MGWTNTGSVDRGGGLLTPQLRAPARYGFADDYDLFDSTIESVASVQCCVRPQSVAAKTPGYRQYPRLDGLSRAVCGAAMRPTPKGAACRSPHRPDRQFRPHQRAHA